LDISSGLRRHSSEIAYLRATSGREMGFVTDGGYWRVRRSTTDLGEQVSLREPCRAGAAQATS
jgi:hypothetical protein